jgi:hypothetical protein
MQRYEFRELIESYLDSGSIVYYPNLATYYALDEFINALRAINDGPPSGYYNKSDPIFEQLAFQLDKVKQNLFGGEATEANIDKESS